MKEKDQRLLAELELSPAMSESEVESRVAVLNMRQLDRLKLMFLRIQSDETAFSESTLKGIMYNELSAYGEALLTLWAAAGEKKNNLPRERTKHN